MPLNDIAVRQAKPTDKARKLADERGLYLLVQPTGGKLWRLDYRFDGKRKTLALGGYPDVSLAEARKRRDQARELLAAGTDPGAAKKAGKQARVEAVANGFEAIGREWHKRKSAMWTASTQEKTLAVLEKDLFPWLGSRPVGEIAAPELLLTLRRIEERGAIDTAHRAKQTAGQIFRYAIATGRADRNPAADLQGALTPVAKKHFPAITDAGEVGPLLRAIEAYKGSLIVRSALRLAPMLFVRPGELRQAEWSEIDIDHGEWRIPAEKMKKRREHIVPLARQAVEILRDLQPLTGHGRYVFQGVRDHGKPMSEGTVNNALKRMGYDTKKEITGHGFRAMARTILHEVLGVDAAVIEHQLAHQVPDLLGATYNRTKFLPQRKAMMQAWADYLDMLRKGQT
ncbi:tyrosine-type recombinase/integrase [Pseudothauera lacus]|uniref:Integrase n=1 Tax=Pseudothauera lacus TaxID=2136175 RepID=A0A2T4IF57_9RHOO|nr:integrase arm-type DNA-binding domain-containing protein [Pseudothauera lacus]PTD96401.1 integrase [Pseudothauera lacus]